MASRVVKADAATATTSARSSVRVETSGLAAHGDGTGRGQDGVRP